MDNLDYRDRLRRLDRPAARGKPAAILSALGGLQRTCMIFRFFKWMAGRHSWLTAGPDLTGRMSEGPHGAKMLQCARASQVR